MAEQIAYVILDAGSPYLVDVDGNPIADSIDLFPNATLGVNSTLKVRPLHRKDKTPYTLAELTDYTTWTFAVTEDYDTTTTQLFSYKAGTTISVQETTEGTVTYTEIVIVMAPTTTELTNFLTVDPDTSQPYDVPRKQAYDLGTPDDLGNGITVGMKLSGFVAAEQQVNPCSTAVLQASA